MTQRITLGGVLAAAAAIVAMMAMDDSSSSRLFAQVAENIRQAESYSAEMVMQSLLPGNPATEEPTKFKQTIYWRAPNDYRFEQQAPSRGPKPIDGQVTGPAEVKIHSVDRPGVSINHVRKEYRTNPARSGQKSPLMMLHSLAKFQGKADKELGKKDVAGVSSEGFRIDIVKIDPSAGDGTMDVWVDGKQRLPTMVIISMKTVGAQMVMQNFKWNAALSPELFDTTPPAGYADKPAPKPDLKTDIARITSALKLYAELSGGHYPQVKVIYGDVALSELQKFAGYTGAPKPEWFKESKFQQTNAASLGLGTITMLLRDNPTASYNGLGVGPSDEKMVLLQWTLPDGRIQRIYGDLRAETLEKP
jgi:outer membrane lipoprotein-sorting protein